MKPEERQIKASFLAGCSEIVLRFILQHFGVEGAWMLGWLGVGMILYSIWLGYYYNKEVTKWQILKK
jgi:hypothetical protein